MGISYVQLRSITLFSCYCVRVRDVSSFRCSKPERDVTHRESTYFLRFFVRSNGLPHYKLKAHNALHIFIATDARQFSFERGLDNFELKLITSLCRAVLYTCGCDMVYCSAFAWDASFRRPLQLSLRFSFEDYDLLACRGSSEGEKALACRRSSRRSTHWSEHSCGRNVVDTSECSIEAWWTATW